jgi:hypothetical protein
MDVSGSASPQRQIHRTLAGFALLAAAALGSVLTAGLLTSRFTGRLARDIPGPAGRFHDRAPRHPVNSTDIGRGAAVRPRGMSPRRRGRQAARACSGPPAASAR